MAKAHRLALEMPEAGGHRLLCVHEDTLSFLDWAKILNKEGKKYGYRIPHKKAPTFLLKILALCDPNVKAIINDLGKSQPPVTNSKIRDILKIEFIDTKQTLIDHFHGVIQVGVKGANMTNKYKNMLKKGEIKETER